MKKFLSLVFISCIIITSVVFIGKPSLIQAQELSEGWENMVVAWDWQPKVGDGEYYPRKILLAGTTYVDIIGGNDSRYEGFALILERTNPLETDPTKFSWRINPTESVIGDVLNDTLVVSDLSKGWSLGGELQFDIGNAKHSWMSDPFSLFAQTVKFPSGSITDMKMVDPNKTYSKGSYDDMSNVELEDYSRIINLIDIDKLFAMKDKSGNEIDLFKDKNCGKEWGPFSSGQSTYDAEGIRANCILFNPGDTHMIINLTTLNGSVLSFNNMEGLITLEPDDQSITQSVKEYFKKTTHQGTSLCSLRDIVEHKAGCTSYTPKEIVGIGDYITDRTITPDEASRYESGIGAVRPNLPGYNIVIKGPEAKKIQNLVDRLNQLEDTRTLNDIPASDVDAVLGNAGFTQDEIATIKKAAPNANNLQSMFEALKSQIGIGAAENTIQQVSNLIMIFIELIAVCVLTFGAILWITAAGSEEQVKKGKTILTYSLLGLVGAAVLHIIIAVIIQMFTEF